MSATVIALRRSCRTLVVEAEKSREAASCRSGADSLDIVECLASKKIRREIPDDAAEKITRQGRSTISSIIMADRPAPPAGKAGLSFQRLPPRW